MNSQHGSSFGTVSVYSHTLPHSHAFLLACTLANPCLGHEPKARVAINKLSINKYFKGIPTSKSSSIGVSNKKEIQLLELQHDY
jgi:hypothetical protein